MPVTCCYCPTKIQWGKTTSGHWMPLETELVSDGPRYSLQKQRNGEFLVVQERVKPGFRPHWASCNLDMTRPGKKARAAEELKKQEGLPWL